MFNVSNDPSVAQRKKLYFLDEMFWRLQCKVCVLSDPFAISSPTLSSGKLHPRTGHEGPEGE
jgi:hypothetical protein